MSDTKWVVPGAGYSTMSPPIDMRRVKIIGTETPAPIVRSIEVPVRERSIPKLRAVGRARSATKRITAHLRDVVNPLLDRLYDKGVCTDTIDELRSAVWAMLTVLENR